VPLDHSGGTPGSQPLAYALLPATGTKTGTLVFLAGGPGEAAIPLARSAGRLLSGVRGSYDLVFVDQRGIGASGAIDCELGSQADVAACGERFGARRAFMSTRETAIDLEDLRVALGAEQLTPLEDARRTAAQYPNAKVLPVPDIGHSVLASDTSRCAVDRLAAFLAGQAVDFCVRRPRPIVPAAVIPASLQDFRPTGGASGTPGRTAGAVAASLFAIAREAALVPGTRRGLAFPALRRGRVVVFRDRIVLLGVEWVRGVRLTGTLRRRTGRIAVSGSQAASGVLRRSGGAFRGTLGGERVVIRPPV